MAPRYLLSEYMEQKLITLNKLINSKKSIKKILTLFVLFKLNINRKHRNSPNNEIKVCIEKWNYSKVGL
jgi:hypothetical protein